MRSKQKVERQRLEVMSSIRRYYMLWIKIVFQDQQLSITMNKESFNSSTKSHVLNIARTENYQQLFQMSLNFIRAIADHDIPKAKATLQYPNRYANLFLMVIQILEKAEQLKKDNSELQNKRAQCSELRQKVNKKRVQLSDKDRIKHSIVQLIEDGCFHSAKGNAAKHKLIYLEEVSQALCEYAWILDQLKMSFKKIAHKPLKEKEFKFSQQRQAIKRMVEDYITRQNSLLSDIEMVLRLMLNPTQSIRFESLKVSNQTRCMLQAVTSQLIFFRKASEQTDKQIQKTIDLLKGKFPNFPINQSDNFFTTIRKYIKQQQSYQIKRLGSQQIATEEDNELSIPERLIFSKSSAPWARIGLSSEQNDKQVNILLSMIVKKLVEVRVIQRQKQKAIKKEEILKEVDKMLQKYVYQQKIFEFSQNQQHQIITALQQINQKLLSSIGKRTQILSTSLRNTASKLQQTVEQSIQYYQSTIDKLQMASTRHQLQKEEHFRGTQQFIATSKEQRSFSDFEDPKEAEFLNELLSKRRNELIDIIRQQRVLLEMSQKQKRDKRKNQQLLQAHIKKLDQSLKESMILRESFMQVEGNDAILVQELTIKNINLSQALQKKQIELAQVKNNIPRLISEAVQKVKIEKQARQRQLEDKEKFFKKQLEQINAKWQKKMHGSISQAILAQRLPANSKIQALIQQKEALQRSLQELTLKNQDLTLKLQEEEKRSEKIEKEDTGLVNRATNILNSNNYDSSMRESTSENPHFQAQKYNDIGNEQIQAKIFEQKCLEEASKTQKQATIKEQYEGKLKIRIVQLQTQVSSLQTQIILVRSQLSVKGQALRQLNKEVHLNKNEAEVLERKLRQMLEKCKQQEKLLQSTSSSNAHLFALGSIFDQNASQERRYLIQILTNFVGSIRKTNLLYRFDSFNKVNPHKYIDQHQHIVLIVKTIYGKYIAGYSKEEFNPTGCKQGFGMLISIWNRNAYQILQNKKSITYDEYYIIFGNSELRIRSQQTKVFSNFGTNNSFFKNRGHKIEAFLGEGTSREVNLDSYEVYSLDIYDGY